jgi:hypothetical protein
MDNATIARKLAEYAAFLEVEEGNLYRVRAYRRAADSVRRLERPLEEVFAAEGNAGLEALPGVGSHIAYTLESLLKTGELRTLRTHTSGFDPERLFASLPGVGSRLARQFHERLGITSLEELEQAAHEGRLAAFGIGSKRLHGLMDTLAARLGRYRVTGAVRSEPPVSAILAVDAEYREQAGLNCLPTIAPRRFNPENRRWLPIHQVERDGWRFRSLYSNTALAHRLGQTRDWVVVYFDNGSSEGQRTVVTETRGDLRGWRVVRGREGDCREHYRSSDVTAVTPAEH